MGSRRDSLQIVCFRHVRVEPAITTGGYEQQLMNRSADEQTLYGTNDAVVLRVERASAK